MAPRYAAAAQTLAAGEDVPSGLQEGTHARVIRDLDRHAARLLTDIRRKREQLLALEGKRRRSLLLGAADVDTLPQVDRACTRCIKRRIARRDPFHARVRIAMAIGARFSGRALLALPECFAVEH